MALGIVASIGLAVYFASPFFVRPPFKVPKTAKFVRCSEFAYWIAYDLQVKFSAPYEDCIKAAEDILAEHRKKAEVHQPDYVRIEIRDRRYLTPKSEDATRYVADDSSQGNKWWFHPSTIKNGLYLGERGAYTPQIWIDKDRGLFYYRETD